MHPTSRYFNVKKGLEISGYHLEFIWGYKMYRYGDKTYRYNLIDDATGEIVARRVTIKALYKVMVDAGIIIESEDEKK